MRPALSCLRIGTTAIALLTLASSALRAQVTETPGTVAPGRFLLEVDGVNLSMGRAEGAGNTYTALLVGSTMITTGLTSTIDVQAGVDVFHRHKLKYRGGSESDSGFGDVWLRTKWTFWRNEAVGAAMAVMPYVKVPTSSGGVGNDSVEGGVIIPWAMAFAGFNAGAMAQWDIVRNDADNGYDSRWFASAYAERTLAFGFSLYGEAVLETTSAGWSRATGQYGGGVLWQFSDHIQLDYQLLRGINSRTADWTHVFRANWEW